MLGPTGGDDRWVGVLERLTEAREDELALMEERGLAGTDLGALDDRLIVRPLETLGLDAEPNDRDGVGALRLGAEGLGDACGEADGPELRLLGLDREA